MEIIKCLWADEKERLMSVREPVFVHEQGFDADIEIDEFDPTSQHFLLLINDSAVATGRLTPCGHIGRIAVLADQRGRGYGRIIMQEIIDHAAGKFDSLELSSQMHAVPFYEKLGFIKVGEPYLECGADHLKMTITIPG